jgi:uncharacterized protein YbbK (DUF523 family)
MKKILVSACLYGDKCRYDEGDVSFDDPTFLKWKAEGRLVKICPEVYGGLKTPRPDSQIRGERVLARTGQDVTEEYKKGAKEAVRLAEENQVVCCIMKQRSPSCGSKIIYDGTFTGSKIKGEGIAVRKLRKAGFKVFGEEDMEEVKSFIDE